MRFNSGLLIEESGPPQLLTHAVLLLKQCLPFDEVFFGLDGFFFFNLALLGLTNSFLSAQNLLVLEALASLFADTLYFTSLAPHRVNCPSRSLTLRRKFHDLIVQGLFFLFLCYFALHTESKPVIDEVFDGLYLLISLTISFRLFPHFVKPGHVLPSKWLIDELGKRLCHFILLIENSSTDSELFQIVEHPVLFIDLTPIHTVKLEFLFDQEQNVETSTPLLSF